MDQLTFDSFTRRTAGLLSRRSLFGGLTAAIVAAGFGPAVGEAKKKGKKNRKSCKKRAGFCRQEFLENCSDFDVDDTDTCVDAINKCCKKAAKCKVTDVDKNFEQCGNVLCKFKSTC